MASRHSGLTPATADANTEAAAVYLDRHHQPPLDMTLDQDDMASVAAINLEMRAADDSQSVKLDQEIRKRLGERIRSLGNVRSDAATSREVHASVLRAVHLDKDWLEVAVDGRHIRVVGVGEQVDDVIGSLVNK